MSLVVVISGPSGVGKSTLVRELSESDPNLEFAVSVTTRPRREHEVNGKAYRFVSQDVFEKMVRNDEFLEWAEVFGNCYGTPRFAVDHARSSGRDLLLDIDVQGAASLQEKLPEAISIFIMPPSRSALEQRLRDRGADEAQVIARRLGEARREIVEYNRYDYIVINGAVEDALGQVCAIVSAERRKRAKMKEALAPILQDFDIRQGEGEETIS